MHASYAVHVKEERLVASTTVATVTIAKRKQCEQEIERLATLLLEFMLLQQQGL
jgi:hypothetical protein